MPKEVREKLFAVESFRQHFEKEIAKLGEEQEYRARITDLLKQYYCNFDDSEIKFFLSKEIKERGWEIFNYLFIRFAIDKALDKGANEKEECSKLL